MAHGIGSCEVKATKGDKSNLVVKVQGYEFYAECTGCSWDVARRSVATGEVRHPWCMFGVLLTQAEAEALLLEKAQATPGAAIIGGLTS